MIRHLRLFCLTAALGLVVLLPGSASAQINVAREGVEFFESKIRPVLVNKCYECHSAKAAKVKAGLYLDTRAALLQGGDTGPAIVPGNPGKSLLIKSLRHQGDIKMPPKEQLAENVIRDFEQWIRMGAPDPRQIENAAWKKLSLEDAKTFWSFKPMQKSSVPMVKNTNWVKGDVDRFVLAKLESKGLQPAADADRASLLRRVSYDLIGLPPTPDEVDAFVNDRAAKAFEKVVDRLLASKHYGERWGRHWLDVARYAESNGNADNTPFPNAWRYRDYVIKSFNEDKPYNQFVTEQIAGDLLTAKTPAEKDDNLTATAFLALTSKPRAQNNPDYKLDLVADQMDVTCRGILGMTIVCARCHDHKFDPISTKDYYAVAGIFDSTNHLSGAGGKKTPSGGLHTLSNGGQAMGASDGKAADVAIAIRGDSTKRGAIVQRDFLTVAKTDKTQPVNRGQSGRLELAAWITQPDNPLTARVMINRIWQHLYGQGLSRVVDNFGLHGEVPTHPELLDNLALKFIADGWSVKKMIKHLVLTRTYQLSSAHSAANYKADPDNLTWWRIPSRRLNAEAIRDGMMFVSGGLVTTPPTGSLAGSNPIAMKKVVGVAKEANYRSVYLGIIRNGLPESLSIFDVADPSLITGQREVTTVPSQALYLMNSPFVIEQAKGFANRVLTSASAADDTARINLAFRLAFARPASSAERDRVQAFLTEATKGGTRQSAWTTFCQTLLASAEFRYLQ